MVALVVKDFFGFLKKYFYYYFFLTLNKKCESLVSGTYKYQAWKGLLTPSCPETLD